MVKNIFSNLKMNSIVFTIQYKAYKCTVNVDFESMTEVMENNKTIFF